MTGTGMGSGTGPGIWTKTEGRAKGRRSPEKEPGNPRSGCRGGTGDAREEATLTSNQSPQPQGLMPQQVRCIMRRIRAQVGQAKDRTEEGEGGAKKCKSSQLSCGRVVENGEDLGAR